MALACAVDSWAQTADPQPQPANGVAVEGFRAYEAGRYEEAREKLALALELNGAPALAVFAARTNVKLGRLVRASELYLLAARMSPKNGPELTQLQVEHDATNERLALLARIPRLTIGLTGDDLETVQVTLDAQPVAIALLGACQLVDPGHHVVRATRDGQMITGDIDLLEGQHMTTTLRFANRAPTKSLEQTLPSIVTTTEGVGLGSRLALSVKEPVIVVPSSFNATTLVHAAERDQDNNVIQRTLGWVGLGLGGASFLVGAATGLAVLSVRDRLNDDCVDDHCKSSVGAEVEYYNRLRTWSTVAFVSGALLTGSGLTLLLTAPTPQNTAQAALVVGAGSATVVGRF